MKFCPQQQNSHKEDHEDINFQNCMKMFQHGRIKLISQFEGSFFSSLRGLIEKLGQGCRSFEKIMECEQTSEAQSKKPQNNKPIISYVNS